MAFRHAALKLPPKLGCLLGLLSSMYYSRGLKDQQYYCSVGFLDDGH